ncbi:MAG: hypothetical protein JWP63_1271 [Candidatus Solibacter sp.]|jgi:hypothetical protein|nr:hypothetical protein [Candidatus Solibacter sp.]
MMGCLNVWRLLTILADHGANLMLRNSNRGPVGWAADQKNRRAVWLLMQRGAAWKDQLALGQPISEILNGDLDRMGIPEEVGKILAKYSCEVRSR